MSYKLWSCLSYALAAAFIFAVVFDRRWATLPLALAFCLVWRGLEGCQQARR